MRGAIVTQGGSRLVRRVLPATARPARTASRTLAAKRSQGAPVESQSPVSTTSNDVAHVLVDLRTAFGAALSGDGSPQQPSAAGDNAPTGGRCGAPGRGRGARARAGAAASGAPGGARGPFGELISSLQAAQLEGEGGSDSATSGASPSSSADASSQQATAVAAGGSSAPVQAASPAQDGASSSGSSSSAAGTGADTRRAATSGWHTGSRQGAGRRGGANGTPGAAAGRGGPRSAPPSKGGLELPRGPKWQGLRRRIQAAGTDPALPTLPALLLVEGHADVAAVSRAVNAPMYVCEGTQALREVKQPELQTLPGLGRDIIVLMDPDERGRELRAYLDGLIGPLLHAHVAEEDATAAEAARAKEAGNRGIEHTPAAAIAAALQRAERSFGPGRREFTMAWAQASGLAGAFDAMPEAGQSPLDRRRRLCARLGLGRCTAAQMLSALNRYYSRQRVEEALEAVDQQE